MEQAALKKILINAIHYQQINCTLADSIATVVGIDLTELIDPVKTAENLLFVGRKLGELGVIDSSTANYYELVADSIMRNLNVFEVA